MNSTTIRTTCTSCGLTRAVPTANVVVALPATTASDSVLPSVVHLCPGCRACNDVPVPWRTTAYLLESGATSITAPEPERIAPRHPERRPAVTTPLTLDDLLDLMAALDADPRSL